MKHVFAAAFLVFAFAIPCTAQTQTATLLNFAPEQIQRVEILYFPERIPVRVALSPERLERLYRYKLEIRDVGKSQEWQQLLSRLRETSLKPSGRGYDHRTAVVLLDQNGRRVAAVYFGQFGKDGTINGESGIITGDLYHWAKSLLKGVAE